MKGSQVDKLWAQGPPEGWVPAPSSERSRVSDHSMFSPVMRRTQRQAREVYIDPKHLMPRPYRAIDVYPTSVLDRGDYQDAALLVQNYVVMDAMRRAPLVRSLDDISAIMEFLYAAWPRTRVLGGECTRRLARMAALRTFGAGQVVLREGDVGSTFYIVVSGEASVVCKGQHLTTLKVGDCYGEDALIAPVARSATVVPSSEFLEVLELRKADYDELLRTYQDGELRRAFFLLRNAVLFKTWAPRRVQRICQLAKRVEVKAGTIIVKQGDTADAVFFVLDGECAVVQDIEVKGINRWPTSINSWEERGRCSHELVPLTSIRRGECFGEQALLTQGAREATVSAITDCTLLALDKGDFEKVVSDGRTGGRRLSVQQRFLQPNDEEVNNMLRSIQGAGPVRLVPSARRSEEDSVREAELMSLQSKDPLYKFEKMLERRRCAELEPSPTRRRFPRPATASVSVDSRPRRRLRGAARHVDGSVSVFSAPTVPWDDPRGRRPSTAGADLLDMSMIRGLSRGDHLNRRRRFAVTCYDDAAALEV